MKIDLSSEFEGFDNIEFDSEIQKQEYVLQQVLEGSSQVVRNSLDWIEGRFGFELLDGVDLEQFLTLGLINKLVERLRMQAGSEIMKARITKIVGPRESDYVGLQAEDMGQ